jgi:hypothetical protein
LTILEFLPACHYAYYSSCIFELSLIWYFSFFILTYVMVILHICLAKINMIDVASLYRKI